MEPKSTALSDIVMTKRLRTALTQPDRYPGWEKKLRGYDTLEDLIGESLWSIKVRPQFGKKSLEELQAILRDHGWETQTTEWWEPFILAKPSS
jgi:hypothetical protein